MMKPNMSSNNAVISRITSQLICRADDIVLSCSVRFPESGQISAGTHVVRQKHLAIVRRLVYQWQLTGGIILSGWPDDGHGPPLPNNVVGIAIPDADRLAQLLWVDDLVTII